MAVFDALVEDVERHIESSKKDAELNEDEATRRGIDSERLDRHLAALEKLGAHLEEVRGELFDLLGENWRYKRNQSFLEWAEKIFELNNLDKYALDSLPTTGKEGYAQLVEDGGFWGPLIGGELAALIRGQKLFRPGPPVERQDIIEREHAVRLISTIHNLWGVSQEEAIFMYCEYKYPDSEEYPIATVTDWFYKTRRAVRAEVDQANNSSKRQVLRVLLDGYFPDLDGKPLAGKPFPKALEELYECSPHLLLGGSLKSSQ
ncbi:hypothetical protein [Shimia aestuarii]|uniref:hypothetical protein n=1 Tax=Shimia aestuarii TaxID=254406 RepID=UPI0010427CFB|nr:hypothetical protein [Shimia aestuarii]